MAQQGTHNAEVETQTIENISVSIYELADNFKKSCSTCSARAIHLIARLQTLKICSNQSADQCRCGTIINFSRIYLTFDRQFNSWIYAGN